MIVRDEARCLRRCIDSVRAHVDQIVVVDTGSVDDTVAIARSAGAEVSHFTWINDFSAARNAALALSRCDWNLVLDADETVYSGHHILDSLRREPPQFIGRIEVCSAFSQAHGQSAVQEASSWISRILPRTVRFEGTVHEQAVSDLPRKDLPVVVHHDGYMPEQMRGKQGRNAALLAQAVASHPDDPYLLYQLGKEHEVRDRFAEAGHAYEQAMRLLDSASPREPGWRHDLLLRHLFVLKALGRTAQALGEAEKAMAHWQDSPDFFFVLGDLLLEHAIQNPEGATEIIPMARQAWQRCLEIGENPRLEGAVKGRGSHLARHNLDALSKTLPGL
ncbi:glycosyltransferase family 2 protein [uncultured Aquabacterium sp.]|nr:glycosyltransferase family 2 protein [uncultured Aquabacterium sp.]